MPTDRPVYPWNLKFELNVHFLDDLVGFLGVS